MKARNAVHLFLKEDIFDRESPLTPPPLCFGVRGGAGEVGEAATSSVVGTPRRGRNAEHLCVQNFFTIDLQTRAMELTNAILRQFVYRAYGQRKPDILVAFNRVFPRAPSALTSKPIVLALLNEMGFPFETLEQQEEERCSPGKQLSQIGCSSFTFFPRFLTSIADASISSMENMERAKNESVLEQIVRYALQQFHDRRLERYFSHSTSSSVDSITDECPSSIQGDSRLSRHRAQDDTTNFEDSTPGEDTTSVMHNFFAQYPSEMGQITAIANALLMQHVRCVNVVPLLPSVDEISRDTDGIAYKMNSLTDKAYTRREATVKLMNLLKMQKSVRASTRVLAELFGVRERGTSFSTSSSGTSVTRDLVDDGLDTPVEPRFPSSLMLQSLLSLYLHQQMLTHRPTPEAVLCRLMWMDRDQLFCSKSLSVRDSSSNCIVSPTSQRLHTSPYGVNIDNVTTSAGDGIVSVRNIEKMTRIGRGSSGEIFAVPRIDNGELVAVKRIYLTENSQKHLEKELSVLKHCNDDVMAGSDEDAHAVVRCYDAFFDGGCAFIVMELMDSGSLMDAFNARSSRAFSEEECCAITFQVLHGLRYLHDTIRQLHRDIKPHNILLNRATGAAKLSDFGLSSSTLQSMGFHQCGSFVGTLAYMSPARVDADSVYGKESDFWSLGITLLQLALGRLPFGPSLFTIVSMAGQPPRLPIESDGKVGPFSSAFHEFIALLLPCQKRRECQKLPLPNFELELGSTQRSISNTYSNSNMTSTMCFIAEEGAITSKTTPPEMEVPVRKADNVQNLPNEDPDLTDLKIDTDQNASEVEQEKIITADTLLQHSWFKEMTWEKSVAILSAVSLEPEPAPGDFKT